MTLEFFMPMIPPTTTHQMKAVKVVHGKPQFYEPHSVKMARKKLMDGLLRHPPLFSFVGGVRLLVKWCFPRGRTHRDGEYRISKPDTDNLQKLLKDCMTDCGYWKDDAQVCSEIVEKFWADVPGIFVHMENVT